MTESKAIKNVEMETKSFETKAKKVVFDKAGKVAVAGAAGFATGFMTVVGTVMAQKAIDKLEERKQKKMLKKAQKKDEAHEVGDLDSTNDEDSEAYLNRIL